MAGKAACVYLVLFLQDRDGEIEDSAFLSSGIIAACSQTLTMAVAHVWPSNRSYRPKPSSSFSIVAISSFNAIDLTMDGLIP